jgi:hypothetical protein
MCKARRATLRAMFVLPLLACTGEQSPVADLFVLPPADLGSALAASSGFDPADGPSIGRAFDATTPVFEATDPTWESPIFIFDELLTDERVRDQNQCPFITLSGDTTTHEGGCRSQDGYEFEGTASDRSWTEDGITWRRLELDLSVVGDTDDVLFDRVALSGVLQRGTPADGAFDTHVDVNLQMEVLGYFERRGGTDPRLEAWASWVASGAYEDVGDSLLVDLTVDIAGAGGMMIQSEALVKTSACPVEADGLATLAEDVIATLGGAASCDACADVAGTLACAP